MRQKIDTPASLVPELEPTPASPAANPAEWMFLQPAIMDQMHDAVVVTDADCIITGCNRAAQQMYGYSAEELMGQKVELIYPEEDRALQMAQILQSIAATGEYRGEIRKRTRSGDSIYVHTAITLLRDGDGNPAGMVGFSSDVTAQKLGDLAVKRNLDIERLLKAERAESSLMRLLFTAVEHAEDVFLLTEAEPIDQPGPRILYVNRAFERMTGYSREEVLGKSPRILQGQKTDRAALDRIRAALKSWRPVREEMTNYRKDGTEFSVDLSIVPIANELGWYTHWMAIQRDTTEQQHLREEVTASQSRLHFLTESIPQLLWTNDKEGYCTFVSQSFARFLGVPEHECLGHGWRQFIHPDDVAHATEIWQGALTASHTYIVEYRFRRHDGQYVWFLHRVVPRLDENGNVREWIGSSTDIDPQKRSEQAIRQTEKLAAVGRLASSIAHEINNPLASVTNLLYLLSTQISLDRTAREYVRSAQEELSRVSEITTQTLRFHKQQSAAAPTRISEVLDSVIAFYRPRLASAGVTVRREYQRTEQLTCFASEIRQIISNLIGNAIEASHPGGILRIRLRPSVTWKYRQRRGIRISFADSGSGIAKDRLARIFEPFYTTKPGTGTGLGLWITKDLIAKHEGSIHVRSSTRTGQSGTLVSVFFPFELRRPNPSDWDPGQRLNHPSSTHSN